MKYMSVAWLGFLLFLGGCSLVPKYERPDMPVSDSWPASSDVNASSDGEDALPMSACTRIPWRDFVLDPRIQSAVQAALDHNRDLRIAALHVARAQALYGIQHAERFPGVGARIDGQVYRLPEPMNEGGEAMTMEQYSVNVGAAEWELDFFGRVRSLEQAALNQYFATEQARAAAQISLVAAVIQSYLNLAADQETLELARATLRTQSDYFDLVQGSRDVGMASDLDLSQARSQVMTAKTEVYRYQWLVASDQHALRLLVGAELEGDWLPAGLAEVQTFSSLNPGLPSEVLLSRPDIMAAEHELIAANARIGAARAALFPRISLTAGLGTMSDELDQLFDPDSFSWSFIPQITAPIFAHGQLKAYVHVSELDREIALTRYEQSIETAFREVSDALALKSALEEELKAQQSLVDALQESYLLSKARYEAGLDGYVGVLINERALYSAQQGLVALRLANLANRVTLFKVLGGGGTAPRVE